MKSTWIIALLSTAIALALGAALLLVWLLLTNLF